MPRSGVDGLAVRFLATATRRAWLGQWPGPLCRPLTGWRQARWHRLVSRRRTAEAQHRRRSVRPRSKCGSTHWPHAPTGWPKLGTTEVWRLVSDFHHPIHLHLVHFQVLSRGPSGPGEYDVGWQDTIDLRPAEDAAIIARFDDYFETS